MAIHLVVQVPFWHYERGSTITDPTEIAKVMEHHAHFVTQVTAPVSAEENATPVDLQTRLGPEKFSK